MADFEPPSFSLGLDLELEPEPEPLNPVPNHEDGFLFRVSDSDPDDPGPSLRRLRRGGPSSSKPVSSPFLRSEDLPSFNLVDDDIEEFSDDHPAPRHGSLCSSSKIPLSGSGILISQHDNEIRENNRKMKQNSSCPPTFTNVDASKEKSKLSASPLRMFQLLDSDSDVDDPSKSVHHKKDVNVVSLPKKNERKRSIQDYFQNSSEKKNKSSTPVSEKQDLWKDFHADKSHSVPTPAFDEFCEEYFNNVEQKRGASVSSAQEKKVNFTNKMTQHPDSGFVGPPSHRYFFHNDLRIQNLVRNRLLNFYPLDSSGDTGSMPFNASTIDYKSQFSHGEAAKQQTGKQSNTGKSARKSRKKINVSNVESTSHASGDWIDPKQTVNIPKDAGRRRVHAEGQSAGHWFTAENGKKVYITSDGKELTGRGAYTRFRKESGKGFKHSKEKKAPKTKKK